MIKIRDSGGRGRVRLDWLDSRLSFSFGDFHDPEYMGFRALRVINDDIIAPGKGFATHPHQDLEIITYVLDGAVKHQDSEGGAGVIRAGDVQRMTAGTGIRHSEYNASPELPLRLIQIWIEPDRKGRQPDYEQRAITADQKRGVLKLVAAGDGRDGALTIHQDVDLYASLLEPGASVSHAPVAGRYVWIQVARGALEINGVALGEGDGAAASNQKRLDIVARTEAEFLLFDLA